MRSAFIVAWQFLVSLSFVFFITFTIFPAVTTDFPLHFLGSMENAQQRISWTMLIYILTFNVTDTIGRWLGGQAFGSIPARPMFIITYLRIVFVASTFIIDYGVGPEWLTGINGDWFKLLNMTLFAFSNGYCSTQCAIKSPSRAPDDKKEIVGTFVGVFITAGIVTGSMAAIGVGSLAAHNPK